MEKGSGTHKLKHCKGKRKQREEAKQVNTNQKKTTRLQNLRKDPRNYSRSQTFTGSKRGYRNDNSLL